jgi:retron-type reverse transcriptase
MLETANNHNEKVRQLQRRLWVCARTSKAQRFHALYDRIHRSDVLWEAWKRVRSNKGAAGVDEITLRSIEERGVTQFLEGIQADLKAGQYPPSPVRRRWIPTIDGKQRPSGIPTVRDRVVQMAAKLVIEAIFEADFQPCSHGFRPKRSATHALEAIREAGNRGYSFVVDADIQGYFDSIDRTTLMELVKERGGSKGIEINTSEAGSGSDGRWRGERNAGGNAAGRRYFTAAGQHLSEQAGSDLGGSMFVAWVLVRYADDFVAMCRQESAAKGALRRIGLVMNRLGLKLHPEKTRMVDLRRGKESFVLPGCRIRKKRSILRNPRWHFMQRWPSPEAMKRIRERVHELTDSRRSGKGVKQIIATLNPVLRGWGNYFRTGNAERKFNQLDS